MMEYTGNLQKMRTEPGKPVNYYLSLGDKEICMNDFLGKPIQLKYLGEINCIRCGRKTAKSFSQGYCYPCFISSPETEECVLHPELCRAHEGIARDMDYAQSHCLIDQFVYLADTGDIKVGVTRSTQLPTRWIDQGATQAMVLARTPNRFLAGQIEVALKQYLPDKTNWRKMLQGLSKAEYSLAEVKSQVIEKLDSSFEPYLVWENELIEIDYPVLDYPQKVASLDLEKSPQIEGILTGIKGQYLMFDQRSVLNVRKFGGYRVMFEPI
ncbi:MAG: DUF2797 domain-containing protein [Bacteroidota bacterium]|nr:MAG: DUF2797 domain-containing protein [Bacteroidota bacterium]